MKAILIILLFSFVALGCTPDTETPKNSNIEIALPPDFNPENYDEIGFACGAGGKGTTLVDEFTKLITNKNYKQLRENLYSSKPGEVYLATISCEKLAENGLIKLNGNELMQIEKNRNKSDTIYICSGCMESMYFTVKQLLNDTNNYLRTEARQWLGELMEKILLKNNLENE